MGTPQHPGFKRKHIFWVKKKPLREWGHRSTPGFKKKHIFGAKKKPLREWGHRNTQVLRETRPYRPYYFTCPRRFELPRRLTSQ